MALPRLEMYSLIGFGGFMKRLLVCLAALLTWLAMSSSAHAEPVKLIVNGRSVSVDGFTDGGRLWVSALPFFQAIGGGARPVKVDQTQALVTITFGDGSKTATVSFVLHKDPVLNSNTIYIAALEALSGLGLRGTVTGAASELTLSISAVPAPNSVPPAAPPAAATRFAPSGLEDADLERAAKEYYDSVTSGRDSAPLLNAVLEGFQIPVYGDARIADTDQIGLRLFAHRPFALTLEFPAMRAGYDNGSFVSLESFLKSELQSGLKTRAGGAFDALSFNAMIGGFFAQPHFSYSQALVAFVGALGRERVRRGLRSRDGADLDSFWGEKTLDPMQFRLLTALFEAGPPSPQLRLGAALPRPAPLMTLSRFVLEPLAASLKRVSTSRGAIWSASAQGDAPKPLRWFFEKVADKAVDEVKAEITPQIDDAIQEYLGIPFPIPEGVDPKSLKDAIVQALKENTSAAFCASVILYGYQIQLTRSPTTIYRRTRGDSSKPYSSSLSVHVSFMDDYRSKVFGTRLTGNIGTAAQLLEKIGCEVPYPGDAAGKAVKWNMPDTLLPHALDEEFKLVQNTTDAQGTARARFDAKFERIPKALRVLQNAAIGNIGVDISNLMPKKWSTIEAGVRSGNKTGIADELLTVVFFDPPKLELEFTSTLDVVDKSGGKLHFKLGAQFALTAKFSGSGDLERLTSMGGSGRLSYLERSVTGGSKDCTVKITDVITGMMEVNLSADDDTSDALNMLLNPGFPSAGGGAPPQETYEPTGGPNCGRKVTAPGWFGQFIGIHGGERGQLLSGGGVPQVGLVLSTSARASSKVLFEKSYDRTVPYNDGTLKENTVIRINAVAGK